VSTDNVIPFDDTSYLLSGKNKERLLESVAEFKAGHGEPTEWATPWGSGSFDQQEARIERAKKPTVYMHECDNCVILSAVSEEHPEAQNYYMELQSLRVTGRTDSVGNTSTILRNILVKAGINVVME
jgi:hypothetical protein